MTPLYTENEFNIAKPSTMLPFKCEKCNKTFYMGKRYITRAIKIGRTRAKFCSRECYNTSKNGKTEVQCLQCEKLFMKKNSEIRKTPNHFCSQSCAGRYNNTHKTKGNRRSKLEEITEETLDILYPNLYVEYNKKTAISSELDIYIPSLKLAIELNGIYHYEPIHGENKLNQVQNNDNNKFQQCQKLGISLCIIDTSKQTYITAKTSQKFIDIIVSVIEQQMLNMSK